MYLLIPINAYECDGARSPPLFTARSSRPPGPALSRAPNQNMVANNGATPHSRASHNSASTWTYRKQCY